MNVNLIEPNEVNINPNIVNGIPQYQDMYIFAELTGTRRGRTVLVKAGDSSKYAEEKTGLEDTFTVNFLGVNQNVENPNYLNFTTNYYQGSTGKNELQFESFGITDIKITTNSSYVPQVSIRFVDIRGLSFFNDDKSPYRILFDFPPPIFQLTIKGYYGKSLTFKLHLVKYTTEFVAENGNFNIDAQFVATTFAPLADVLFRYIINFPLMPRNLGDKSMNSAPNMRPRNTNELIKKLKALMPAITEQLKSSDESKLYEKSIKAIDSNKLAFETLANQEDLKGSYILLVDNSQMFSTQKVSKLNGIYEYNSYLKTLGSESKSNDIQKRLIIAYRDASALGNVSVNPESQPSYVLPTYNTFDGLEATKLNNYRTTLIKKIEGYEAESGFDVSINDIGVAQHFSDDFDVAINGKGNTQTFYTGIDISDVYWKIFQNDVRQQVERFNSANALTEKINAIVIKELDMLPTIYNIFKIILDDVDTFFETIRQVSIKAENEHHNIPDYKSIIAGSEFGDSTTPDRIFAFPLIINRWARVCGGNREERIAPIDLSKRTPTPFPEIELVQDFIDTFNQQDLSKNLPTLKQEQNDDGTFKWIPISPFDSAFGSKSPASPYPMDNITISQNTDDKKAEIIRKLLERFYILSQNVIPETFYGATDKNVRDAYIQLFAEAEAVNMATAVVNPAYRNMLLDFADKAKNADGFYSYLANTSSLSNIWDFSTINTMSFPLTNYDDVYSNKNNSGFTGVCLDEIEIEEQFLEQETAEKKSNKPVQVFLTEVWDSKRWKELNKIDRHYTFTQWNTLFVKDLLRGRRKSKNTEPDKDMKFVGSDCIMTRFLSNESRTIDNDKADDLLNDGNSGWGMSTQYRTKSDADGLESFDNIVDIWVNELAYHDEAIHSVVETSSKFSALMMLSNFGYSLSPFNIYPKNLGRSIFNLPAVVEVPQYLPAYIGALVGETGDTFVNELKDFFINGDGRELSNNGLFIFADIHDVNNHLSEIDKLRFEDRYDSFMSIYYNSMLTAFVSLYNDIQTMVAEAIDKGIIKNKESDIIDYKKKKYKELLDQTESKDASYYDRLILPLIKRVSLANYSQLTFNTSNTGTVGYESLKNLNKTNKKNLNDKFFNAFLPKLKSEIGAKQAETKELEDKQKKLKGDPDIITQTYYSFKNINDKWLANPEDTATSGFPFNNVGQPLISLFAFVDRAMNPVGDTMINPESLIQMYDDPNISVYGALSSLLSANGFEFFPLQNFMKYTEGEWEESFKINTGPLSNAPTQAFVCMYIGGSSSYPTNISNGFADDGVKDLGDPPLDFNTNNIECQNQFANSDNPNDNQVRTNPNFPWRQVRAFRVRFGEQNQSMFTGIKIDSKEFPETNESIQILSKLAGDGSASAPIEKGQNLYSIYENRAYSATITAMGNAMIQPTQYFQLENVPMFNGAYLILTVEHSITPNKMMTTFTGTKILRFPYPRVLSPAAVFGFRDGSSENTSLYDLSPGQAMAGICTDPNTHYNSMYGHKIE